MIFSLKVLISSQPRYVRSWASTPRFGYKQFTGLFALRVAPLRYASLFCRATSLPSVFGGSYAISAVDRCILQQIAGFCNQN